MFDVKANTVDCAQKCVLDMRAQYAGLSEAQISETLTNDASWGELEAFRTSLAIVRNQKKANEEKPMPRPLIPYHSRTQQLQMRLAPAMPPAPARTFRQALTSSTIFIPAPSIVSPGFKKKYTGINWANFENILKFYALGVLYKGALTQQQEKDKADLARAIEEVYKTKHPTRPKTAQEIVDNVKGTYIQYGKDIIHALGVPDREIRSALMSNLESEITQTRNERNADQLRKVMRKSTDIVSLLRARYKSK